MKLLLAEDTADLNRAVSAVLEHEGYSVDRAFDGQQAMDYLQSGGYDAVILDIMMPKKDGLEVLKEMRERHIMTPVMLLTAKTEIDDRVAGLDAGADDYLPKPFAMKEMLARVRSMIRRREIYEESALSFADITLDPAGFVLQSRNSVRLSIKEFELLKTLMTNTDIELSTQYLLEHVWRGEPNVHEDTVWLYVSYLRGKLRSVGSPVTIEGGRGGSFRLRAQTEEEA